MSNDSPDIDCPQCKARAPYLVGNGCPRCASQPPPQPNQPRPVWDMVIDDMRARDQLGRKRYGTPLQADNGRDALRDAYEESLDLCVYLRQAIAERDASVASPPAPVCTHPSQSGRNGHWVCNDCDAVLAPLKAA